MPSPGDGGLLSVLQNGVIAINNLAKSLSQAFPTITSVSTTVSSTTEVAYGLVQTSSGGTYKIALLPSS